MAVSASPHFFGFRLYSERDQIMIDKQVNPCFTERFESSNKAITYQLGALNKNYVLVQKTAYVDGYSHIDRRGDFIPND